MLRFARLFVLALVVFMPAVSNAGPAEEGAAAIDRWNAAYNANDLEALLKVYAPDAILQGTSEPQINVGTADLRKYFRNLPKGGSSNSIHERRIFVINDTTVLGVGFYAFRGGRPSRFSFLVVKRGDEWLIAHHHSSSMPAGRP
jgi:hypothetical protein